MPATRRSFAIQPDGGGHTVGGSPMKKLHCIAALAALTTTGLLTAQTNSETTSRGPHRGGPGRHGGHPIVRALDTDKDGDISAAEITAAPTALAKLDTNGDGTISSEELRPARPARPEGAPTKSGTPVVTNGAARFTDPVMLALDANKDGALSASEISGAAASLKALDANSDGNVTHDELRPLPPEKN